MSPHRSVDPMILELEEPGLGTRSKEKRDARVRNMAFQKVEIYIERLEQHFSKCEGVPETLSEALPPSFQ